MPLDMRILIGLTYYSPYTSGLTIYAVRQAQALVRAGHQVTVLTSRFDRSLPEEEVLEGVRVIRADVWMRIGKGPLMPGMTVKAWSLVRKADIVNLHLPQLDAAPISLIARLFGKPVVSTYHCDLLLPQGFVNRIANAVSNLAGHVAAGLSSAVVQNSRDYAENSSFLRRYLHKLHPIAPPIELPQTGEADHAAFREKYRIEPGQRLIGMAGRLAAEKGADVLAQAMPLILEKHPTARVLFAGPYQNLPGEEAIARKVLPLAERLGEHWTFLGVLSPQELAAFFRSCEVIVMPSLNRTESYGMTQVESMTCGTPVVVSDLPGVRVPVRTTGMGKIVSPGNAAELAQAIVEVLDHPEAYQGDASLLAATSTPEYTAREYEKLFVDVQERQAARKPGVL